MYQLGGKMAEGGSRVLPSFKGYEPAGNDILVVVQRRSVSIIHKRTVHLNYLEEF
ncbi:hypothetical protein [Bacillus sp. UNC437CL72CviS29]|uniref:hypothetical protein n=1 Tax=Bacillus sp. UNC437CL72CviS29 TaxID=1340430 RepID=UPI000AD54A38|nr:hypothetical protein [Bacillus sp. UNC437CL72CviS29]